MTAGTSLAPKQLLRFLVTGGFNTVAGYGLFALLTWALTGVVPHAYMVAYLVATILSITGAFLGYKFFVFRTRGNFLREYLSFYIVYGSSALAGLALLPVAVSAVSLILDDKSNAPYVAQAVLLPFGVAVNYLGHSRYSFRPGPHGGAAVGHEPAAEGAGARSESLEEDGD